MKQKLTYSFFICITLLFVVNILNIVPEVSAQTGTGNGQDIVNDLGQTLKESLKAEEKILSAIRIALKGSNVKKYILRPQ